jgi:hypothetical protein
MSDGRSKGIDDHGGLWAIGSFFSCEKSGKYNIVRNGNDICEN